jgi:hypothetical protein
MATKLSTQILLHLAKVEQFQTKALESLRISRINFHTHTNYLAHIKYLKEFILWRLDNG